MGSRHQSLSVNDFFLKVTDGTAPEVLDTSPVARSAITRTNISRSREGQLSCPGEWLGPALKSWFADNRSSILVIQTQFNSRFEMRAILGQLSEHVYQRSQHMIWAFRPIRDGNIGEPVRSGSTTMIDLLKSLVLQALQLKETTKPQLQMLSINVEHATAYDWLNLLCEILDQLQLVYLLIDNEAAENDLNSSTSPGCLSDLNWPSCLTHLLDGLEQRTTNSTLKVILSGYGSSINPSHWRDTTVERSARWARAPDKSRPARTAGRRLRLPGPVEGFKTLRPFLELPVPPSSQNMANRNSQQRLRLRPETQLSSTVARNPDTIEWSRQTSQKAPIESIDQYRELETPSSNQVERLPLQEQETGAEQVQTTGKCKGRQTSGESLTRRIYSTELPASRSSPDFQKRISQERGVLKTSALRLFDDETENISESDRGIAISEEFFSLLDIFHRVHMSHDIETRVRIAILDTGVDERQMGFRYRREQILEDREDLDSGLQGDPVKAIKSFVGMPLKDEHGHGTHVAETLLRVAPQADLYIAKISHGSSITETAHIADAIKWAVENKCDIINMSFGIASSSTSTESFDMVNDAIKAADNAQILLFAAASNSGGNAPRTYPARNARVVCIHAVDGRGNNSGGMNPPVDQWPDSFATLGIGVKCTWNGQFVYKSGTSFATPVAAGIAANVLDYVSYSVRLGRISQQKARILREGEGIKKLFTMLMSIPRDGFHFVAPWHLWKEFERDDEYIWGRLRRDFVL